MYRLRKICLVVFFSLFSIIFSVMGFSTITHAEEAGFNLMFSETLFKTYVVGDTVNLPKPVESVEYYILVEKKEGDSLIIKKEITDINSKFTFEETGEYIISYVYKVNDKTCNTNINVTVEEFKNGFDFSAFPENKYWQQNRQLMKNWHKRCNFQRASLFSLFFRLKSKGLRLPIIPLSTF